MNELQELLRPSKHGMNVGVPDEVATHLSVSAHHFWLRDGAAWPSSLPAARWASRR